MDDQGKFTYTYSAKRQEEIDGIRKKYLLPEEEDKMGQLRRLDRSAETPGRIIALIVGILGMLVMGFGLTCVLEWADRYFVLGIVIGVAGIACMCAAYPLFRRITQRNRKRLAPQVLRLTEELSGKAVSEKE